jgi:hypothetical protein
MECGGLTPPWMARLLFKELDSASTGNARFADAAASSRGHPISQGGGVKPPHSIKKASGSAGCRNMRVEKLLGKTRF